MPAVKTGEQEQRVWPNTNAHRATEAKCLIGLIDGQLVLRVTMLESIFRLTKTLSNHQQAKDLELASGLLCCRYPQ
jgi:hypothetical protein